MGGERRQAVLLEHIVGKEQLHSPAFLDWAHTFPAMEQLAASRKCLVIITLNDFVLDAVRAQHRHCGPLGGQAGLSLSLAGPRHAAPFPGLTDGEKRLILTKHMQRAGRDLSESVVEKILSADRSGVFFAARCRQLAESAKEGEEEGGEEEEEEEAECLKLFTSEEARGGSLGACGSGPKVHVKISPEVIKKSLLKPTRKAGSWNIAFVGGQEVIRKEFSDEWWTAEGARSSVDVASDVDSQGDGANAPRESEQPTDRDSEQPASAGEEEKRKANVRAASDPTVRLHRACQEGDLDSALASLASGVDLSAKDRLAFTALHAASQAGHEAIVRALLGYQCPVTAEDGRQWTALHAACAGGHCSVVQLLIQHGAQLETQTFDGMGPLHIACRHGHTEAVRVLLENGANVEDRQNTGYRVHPLHVAAFYGHAQVVELLIRFQARQDARDRGSWLPLHYACQQGHLQVVELLTSSTARSAAQAGQTRTLHVDCPNDHTGFVRGLSQCGVFSHDPEGKATVCRSCYLGNKAALENLSLHYLSPDLPAANDVTGLFLAAQNGHYPVLKALLKAGACCEVRTAGGWTPLLAASDKGHVEVAQLLLEYKAFVDESLDGVLLTALHLACRGGHKDVVDVLLRHGASPDLRDNHGYSPLHHACRAGRANVLPPLLARVKEAYSDRGAAAETLLSEACGHGNAEVVHCLINLMPNILVNAQGPPAVHEACRYGQCDTLKILLEHSFPVDAPQETGDDKGETPLHVASRDGHDSTVEMLIQYGAAVDVANSRGDLPLHLACRHNRVGAAKALLEKGAADVETKDSLGRTALHIAADQGFDGLVTLLVESKADVNARDSEQNTPLVLARSHREVDILLANKADHSIRNSKGRTLLHDVCSWGQERTVRSLLLAKADTEARDGSGQTPLMNACRARKNGVSIARLLLESGADVGAADDAGATPVQLACSRGDVELTRLFIPHGARLDSRDSEGHTPLHTACGEGHAEVAATLLRAGAAVNEVNHEGDTPLHLACRRLHPGLARVLLERGAATGTHNKAGLSPLSLLHAMQLEQPQSSSRPAPFFPPPVFFGVNKPSPSQQASMQRGEALRREVHERKEREEAEQNEERKRKLDRRAELLRLCSMEYNQRSAQHVHNSADDQRPPRRSDTEGRTVSARDVPPPAVNRRGARDEEEKASKENKPARKDKPRQEDKQEEEEETEEGREEGGEGGEARVRETEGSAAEGEATEKNVPRETSAAVLQQSDEERRARQPAAADSALGNKDPVQPESHATRGTGEAETAASRPEKGQTLTAVEVQPNPAREAGSRSAADPALKHQQGEAQAAACSHPEQQLSPDDFATPSSSSSSSSGLMSSHVKFATPLHAACFHGQADLVLRHLPTFSGDINAAAVAAGDDDAGRTALHYACAGGHSDIAAVLLTLLRADPAVSDGCGRTPLHAASLRGHLDTADLLLTHGVHVDAADTEGRTALHLASRQGHGMVAAVLLARAAQLDAADRLGNTPLMLAASGGHVGVCVLLLNAGADPEARNEAGESGSRLANRAALPPLLAQVMARHAKGTRRPPADRDHED